MVVHELPIPNCSLRHSILNNELRGAWKGFITSSHNFHPFSHIHGVKLVFFQIYIMCLQMQFEKEFPSPFQPVSL